ncbi:sigma-54 dependent transcriptional regulator [bacterium]|nr:sigma-54 dependent transcriptional regulator [bacterium]
MDHTRILVVDDEPVIVESIKDYFDYLTITVFTDPVEATEELKNQYYDIVIADYKMPRISGLELLIEAKKNESYDYGILLTAFADKELLQQFINNNLISQILEKPLNLPVLGNSLAVAIEQVTKKQKSKADLIALKQKFDELKRQESSLHESIIGLDKSLGEVHNNVKRICKTSENVLLTGETGTGKSIIARLIHEMSNRKDKPFVQINCGAIPIQLIESELFGHKKGAFTGAVTERKGKIELSDSGTLFLDEIAELTLEMQTRLLNVVQEKKVEQLGSDLVRKVDFRLICATNRNLEQAIREKTFREDLFYRINTFPICIPSLNERMEDLEDLVNHLTVKFSQELGKRIVTLNAKALEKLRSYSWPGNIRELENAIKRAIILLDHNRSEIQEKDFDFLFSPRQAENISFDGAIVSIRDYIVTHKTDLKTIEKQILSSLEDLFQGNVMEASRNSGIAKDRFYRAKKFNSFNR